MSPAEKQATDITRKTNGDRLIQIRTHHGTLCPGDRLNDVSQLIGRRSEAEGRTYYIACFQVSPRRLFTAAAILNTSDENQKAFTQSANTCPVEPYENCNVDAVTAEKNVATVDRFSRFDAACC